MSKNSFRTKTVVIKRQDIEKKLVPLICSWCNRIYKIDDWMVEEGNTFGVSHGICRDCFDKKQNELDGDSVKYICKSCGHAYNPSEDDIDNKTKSNTSFTQETLKRKCPKCKAEKSTFTKL